jgi:hypothetical protein
MFSINDARDLYLDRVIDKNRSYFDEIENDIKSSVENDEKSAVIPGNSYTMVGAIGRHLQNLGFTHSFEYKPYSGTYVVTISGWAEK